MPAAAAVSHQPHGDFFGFMSSSFCTTPCSTSSCVETIRVQSDNAIFHGRSPFGMLL
jgi:hypothetical protein